MPDPRPSAPITVRRCASAACGRELFAAVAFCPYCATDQRRASVCRVSSLSPAELTEDGRSRPELDLLGSRLDLARKLVWRAERAGRLVEKTWTSTGTVWTDVESTVRPEISLGDGRLRARPPVAAGGAPLHGAERWSVEVTDADGASQSLSFVVQHVGRPVGDTRPGVQPIDQIVANGSVANDAAPAVVPPPAPVPYPTAEVGALTDQIDRMQRAMRLRQAGRFVIRYSPAVSWLAAMAFAACLLWLIGALDLDQPASTDVVGAQHFTSTFSWLNALRLVGLSLLFVGAMVTATRWMAGAAIRDLAGTMPDLRSHFVPSIAPSRLEISKDQRRTGPYSVAQLREMFRNGTVDLTTLVTCEGLPDWRPLALIPGALDNGPPDRTRMRRLAATIAGEAAVPAFAGYARAIAARTDQLRALDQKHPDILPPKANRLKRASTALAVGGTVAATFFLFGLSYADDLMLFVQRPVAPSRAASPAPSNGRTRPKAKPPAIQAAAPEGPSKVGNAATEPSDEAPKPARKTAIRAKHAEARVEADIGARPPQAATPIPVEARPSTDTGDAPAAKSAATIEAEKRERLRREMLK